MSSSVIRFMTPKQATNLKQDVAEYRDVKKQRDDAKTRVENAVQKQKIGHEKIAEAKQGQALGKKMQVKGKKLQVEGKQLQVEGKQLQVEGKQLQVEAKQMRDDSHQILDNTIEKMIVGVENNLRTKLILMDGHEVLLAKLDSLLVEIKACKVKHNTGVDVTKDVQAFSARLQGLAGEMNAFAKSNALKK